MPTYRLHIEYGRGSRCVDFDGVEFLDEAAALAEADLGLRELLAAAIRNEAEGPTAITVEDSGGHRIAQVTRQQVVPLSWKSSD